MRKLLIAFILLLLSGCEELVIEKDPKSEIIKSENENRSKVESEKTSKDGHVFTADVIEPSEIVIHESASLIESMVSDVTGDGIEEEILLYITPSPFDEETGEAIWWEDLHFWQLVVKDGERTYQLYNYDVIGTLSFWISHTPEKRIIIVNESGTQLIVSEYRYDNEVFQEKVLLDTGGTFERSSKECILRRCTQAEEKSEPLYVTKEEVLKEAKRLEPSPNVKWQTEIVENYEIPHEAEKRTAWKVQGVYPFGNKIIIHFDAYTGEQLVLTETEPPK
ncbi:hypothetical protein GCM10008967_28530 [Bacillus carboniphilus]|uniref:PepSY domain-containing protein n=1 Tax=Bacillus carboniphilus TaxID=86663 RepID=A0ABP3G748_9BACI